MSDINAEFNTKVAELRGVEKELNNKIKILDRVQKELKLKSERELSFTEQYTEVRSEKETLESERNTLQSEKDSLKDQLDDAIQDKKSAEAQAEFERRRAAELATDLDDARDEAEFYEDKWNECEAQLNACQNP